LSWEIKQGDCLQVLKTMADESVHCVVTSPPYWGLRDYGVAGQLGLEKTPATMNIRVRDAKKGILDKKSGGANGCKATEEETDNYGKEEHGETRTVGWKATCKCGSGAGAGDQRLDEQSGRAEGVLLGSPGLRADAQAPVSVPEGEAHPLKPCVVMDIFHGAGTTCLVSTRLQRDYKGIELNSEYIAISRRRVISDAPLLNTPAEVTA
jgi:hypothetical protein